MRIMFPPSLATIPTYDVGRRGASPLLGMWHHHPGLFQGKLYAIMIEAPLTWNLCRPQAPILMPELEKSEYELVWLQNIVERETEFLRIFSYLLDLEKYKY